MLDASDVVLWTQEEGEAVTGEADPDRQARWVLSRPGARTDWCVVKRGAEGALLAAKSQGVYTQQALQVDVRDTGEWGGGGVAAAAARPARRGACI